MKILATGMGWVDQIPGGLNQYFAGYLKAMNHLGHSVEGLLTGGGGKLVAPPYIRDVNPDPDHSNPDTYSRVRSFQSVVKKRTEDFKPHVFNPHFALYASLITRNVIPGNVPIVTHFHGPWADESRVEDKGSRVQKYVRYQVKRKIEQTAYRRSDAFIVLSDYFSDILSNEFGISKERIHRIPGAVDIERFRPAEDRNSLRSELGLREDQQVLFCARRLVRRMGIDNLIKAMAPVSRSAPGTVLYIAGGGHLQDELEQLIKDLNLQSTVRLLGRVSNEALVKWYQAADLSIVPTVTLEGFGLVTTEALACGTPVLGTPYGGTKEIIEPFASQLLFRDKTPEAIAEKIISVVQGGCPVPSREECRQYVLEHYTWDRVAKLVTHVFEKAIEVRKDKMRHEGSLL